MFDTIVHSSSPITLVGGGSVTKRDLILATSLAPDVVAADGGAGAALEAGFTPSAVIGDLDSFDPALGDQLPQNALHYIDDQNTTDFEKALGAIDAPLIVAAGFTGGRFDHQLAACSALVRFHHVPCVMLGAQEVIFHCPPRFVMDVPQGVVVSLFPVLPVQGTSRGLLWPIDGLDLRPGARIGTSNEALGGRVEITVEAPGMLVILPRDLLGAVTTALLQP